MQNTRKILSAVLLSVLCLVAMLVMSSCGDTGLDDILSLDAPTNVKYSGSSVTWDSVSGAAKYSVQINGGAEVSVSTNSFPYTSKADFTVSVRAVSSSGRVISDPTEMSFKYLGAILSVEVDDEGTISWLPVDGATGYLMKLDNIELPLGNVLSYSEFTEGSHSVSVRPIVDGDESYFSTWTTPISLTVLGKVNPESISYDGTYISFSSVSHATSYNVYIDGDLYESEITSKKVAYDAGNKDFTVTIQALGNAKNKIFDGAVSDPKEFIYLDTVTGVKIEDGILKWDSVEKADSYQLMIDGKVVEKALTKNQYDNGKYLVAGKNIEISIKAVSNDKACFSTFSTPISVYLLKAPVLMWNKDLSLDGGEYSIYWNEVDSAIGYEITVTDPEGHVATYNYGASEAHFAHEYDIVGTYTVTARALADEATDSKYSSLSSQEVIVIRPEDPKKGGNFITSDPYNLAAGFTVTCDTNSKASEYHLFKNDSLLMKQTKSQFIVSNLIDENVIDGQEDTYSVKLMGSVRTVGGKITATLNSLHTLDFTITILATPQNVRMEGYLVKYDEVANASNGYGITGVGSAGAVTESSLSRDLSSELQPGNYNVQVCAKGNGSDVLASNYSAGLVVHRLSAPTDIKIDTDLSSNGILKYFVEDRAQSVEIWIDNVQVVSVEDVINNMNDYVKTTGTGVKMVAVANYTSTDGVYYMSSPASNTKQFIKLSAPTNLTFDNTQLKWNLEGISTSAVGQITFRIFNESEVVLSAAQNDRALDISSLEGGKTYNFTIVAQGDGNTYINSEPSSVATIYKLETPDVSTLLNNYVWDSVSSATSYAVTVDGKIFDAAYHQSNTQYVFDPASAFDKVKTYTLTFTAIGDGGINTINSAPLIIEQEVKQMDEPNFKVSYEADVFNPQKAIVVDITEESAYASGYRYVINGITTELKGAGSTQFKHTASNPGEYVVYVTAIGQVFDDEGVYLVDSQTVGGSANRDYTINLLSQVNQNSMLLDADGRLTFDAVKGTDGYKIKVTLATASGSAEYTALVNNNSLNIKQAIKDGHFEGITSYLDVTSVSVTVNANASLPQKVSGVATTKDWTGNLHP